MLDGAVLVLCGVAGVQSQSYTVDRQMRRYNVPRLAFVNKLDRAGASGKRVADQLKDKLRHHTVVTQMQIGFEDRFEGVIDLIRMKAFYFDGDNGEDIREEEIPAALVDEAKAAPQGDDHRHRRGGLGHGREVPDGAGADHRGDPGGHPPGDASPSRPRRCSWARPTRTRASSSARRA